MVAKDGTPLEKASYAFPEVQEFMLSLIREVAEEFDIDEIVRSYPSVKRADVQAVIKYAADLASERIIPFAPGPT